MILFLKNKINLVFFSSFVIFFIVVGIKKFDFYIEGDGLEYVMMTESFFRHGSPELRIADAVSYKNHWKPREWEKMYKKGIFESTYLNPVNYQLKNPLENFGGYFLSKDNKFYCYHFWGYSFFAVPFRYITHWFSINPLYTFLFANLFFLVVFFAVLWLFSSFDFYHKLFFSFIVTMPSAYWYISWEHTEVYMLSLAATSLILFHQNRHKLSFLLMALCAWQNQTFILLPATALLFLLIKEPKSFFRTSFIYGPILLLGLIPSLFYYVHFDHISLIPFSGHLEPRMATLNRFVGFFYDLNQGMLLAAPVILLLFPFATLKRVYSSFRKKSVPDYSLLFVFSVFGMTYVFIQMKNWSPGESVAHRYTTWTLPVVAWFVLLFAKDTLKNVWFKIFGVLSIALNVLMIVLHRDYDKYDWSGERMMPLAKLVFLNYPQLYNPDPVIFSMRSIQTYGKENDLVPYVKNKKLLKLLVLDERKDTLKHFGFDEAEMKELEKQDQYYGWIYVPNALVEKYGDNFVTLFRKIKIETVVRGIYNNPDWYNSVIQRAEEFKIPIDSVMRMDAAYVVDQEL
jgi:hypothetical protein